MYYCHGTRGCYWNGSNPIKTADGHRCPVCGNDAYPDKCKEGIMQTGHEIIKGQFELMQLHGRKGDKAGAKACLESAKRIWEELKDVDETVKTNLEYYKKNYDHFIKMVS